MKKIYNTPYIQITEIKSDDVMMTVSGFKTTDKNGKLIFDNTARNEITSY